MKIGIGMEYFDGKKDMLPIIQEDGKELFVVDAEKKDILIDICEEVNECEELKNKLEKSEPQNRELTQDIEKIVNRLNFLKKNGAFYATDAWVLDILSNALAKIEEVE